MSRISNQLNSNKTNIHEQTSSAVWNNATGFLPISMTNDYLFRALLQRNHLSQNLKFVNISPDIFLNLYIIIHKWME